MIFRLPSRWPAVVRGTGSSWSSGRGLPNSLVLLRQVLQQHWRRLFQGHCVAPAVQAQAALSSLEGIHLRKETQEKQSVG